MRLARPEEMAVTTGIAMRAAVQAARAVVGRVEVGRAAMGSDPVASATSARPAAIPVARNRTGLLGGRVPQGHRGQS